RDDADVVDDRVLPEGAHIRTGEAHRARRGLVQARCEIEDRRLARPRWPHEGDMAARFGDERYPVEGGTRVLGRIRVAEDDVLELHPSSGSGRLVDADRTGCVADLRHEVEIVEDAG